MGVPLNEQWDGPRISDWPGNNWILPPEVGFTTSGATFADRISGGRAVSESPNPRPDCGTDGTPVDHWEQVWRIGTLSIGVGQSVQRNTLERHLEFARHSDIRY